MFASTVVSANRTSDTINSLLARCSPKQVDASASRQASSSSTGGVDAPAAKALAWPCARWRHTATYIQENRYAWSYDMSINSHIIE